MRRIFTLYVLIILFGLKGIGQVSSYSYTQSSNTYASIAGTTVPLGTSPFTGWDDNVASLNIPFTYIFNGTGYTTCSVNSNGYLTFGLTFSNTTGYNALSATTGYAGAVAAFSRDLVNNTSTVVYGTMGTTPNRVFIVQWNNARRYSGGAVSGDVLNFQIRLYETSNKAEIMYGTCTATNTTLTSEVGLRGTSNTDFNNRTTTTNWSSTTSGIAGATCTSSSTIMPASGLTFTWFPPACTSPLMGVPGSVTSSSASIPFTCTSCSPGNAYIIEYGLTGFTPGTGATAGTGGTIVTGTASPIAVSSLSANTTYDVYVRQNCTASANGYSANSTKATFTTLPGCVTATSPVNNATGICSIPPAFTWTAPANGATSYKFYLGTDGGGITTPTSLINGTNVGNVLTYSPSVTLASNTIYYWQVVAVNATGSATSCSIQKFTTITYSAGAVAPPYTQNFECTNDLNFVNGAQTNQWVIGVATNNGGTHSAYISNDGGTTNTYSTGSSSTVHFYKDITFAVNNTGTISFDWKGLGESGYDRLLVYIAPATVTPVAGTPASNSTTLTGATLLWTQPNSTQSAFVNATIPLTTAQIGNTAGSATARIIFTWQNDGSVGNTPPAGAIDNISITATVPPACTSPLMGVPGSVTSSSASIPFTCTSCSPGNAYIIEYGLTGFTPGTGATAGTGGTIVTGTASPIAVSSLSANTTYDVYVRQNCTASANGYSANSTKATFTTLPGCVTATSPVNNATGICSIPPAFTWTAPANGATSYKFYLGTDGGGITTPTSLINGTNVGNVLTYSPSVTLASNTIYYWQVVAVNATGSATSCSIQKFTTITYSAGAVAPPYTQNFECTNDLNFVNGAQTNQWVIGVATNNGGTHSAYISNDGGTTNTYSTGSSSTVHFYKDITFAVNNTGTISFDWKGLGESGYDRLLVYIAPATVTPVAGTPASNSTTLTGATLLWTQPNSTQSAFVNATIPLTTAQIGNTAGSATARIIFTWQNDGSVGNTPPAGAIDNISITATVPPACTSPLTGVPGSVTSSSASIPFTCTSCSPGNAYIIEYGLTGFTPGTGATAGTGGTIVTGTASPIAVSSLSANTTYDVYVRQNCTASANGYSANSTKATFTTLCGTVTVPYIQNFDGVTAPAIPNCTSIQDVNGDGYTWKTSTAAYNSSPNSLRYAYNSATTTVAANDWWFTPGINVISGTTYIITFTYRAEIASYPEGLEIKTGASANAAGMTSAALYSNTSISNITFTTATIIYTASSTGVQYFGWHAISAANEYNLYVDDISITAGTGRYWIGYGAGGTSSQTDLSAPANWSGGTTLLPTDNYYMYFSSAGLGSDAPANTFATTQTSALTMNSLTINFNGNGNGLKKVNINVAKNLTITSALTITNASSGSNNHEIDFSIASNSTVNCASFSTFATGSGSGSYTPVLDLIVAAGSTFNCTGAWASNCTASSSQTYTFVDNSGIINCGSMTTIGTAIGSLYDPIIDFENYAGAIWTCSGNWNCSIDNFTSSFIDNAGTLNINGLTTATASSTAFEYIYWLVGNSATTTFKGSANFGSAADNGGNNLTLFGGIGAATTGKFVFNADLTFGKSSGTVPASNDPYVKPLYPSGSFVFDATSAQTLTDNTGVYFHIPGNMIVGSSNNPTVTIVKGATTYSPDDMFDIYTNLSINGTSTLIIPSNEILNNYSGTGTVSVANGATLKLGGITSITPATNIYTTNIGSNFPYNFSVRTLGNTSTVEYNGMSNQTVYATPIYGNLIFTNPSTKTAGGNITALSNLTNNSTSLFDVSATPYNVSVGGNWVNNNPTANSFNQRTGLVTLNTGISSVITDVSGTNNFYKLTVAKTGNAIATMSNNLTVANIATISSGYLSINDKILSLTGTSTALTTANGRFIGTQSSSLIIGNGTVAAAASPVYFLQNVFPGNPYNNYLKNLTVNTSAGLTLGGNASTGDTLNIVSGNATDGYGTVLANGTITSNGLLTLKSRSNGTARVDKSSGSIVGNVIVETNIPARRGWRFMSVPVDADTLTIRTAWQEGTNNLNLNYATHADPNPGYGTDITGDNITSNGFDYNTTTNPSLITWVQNTGKWSTTAPATISTPITNSNYSAYCLFVRGSRAVHLDQANLAVPDSTILRITGKVYNGSKSINFPATTVPGELLFVPNPYASSVDITNIINSTPNIYTKIFWVYDPAYNGDSRNIGGYVSYANGMIVPPSTPNYPSAAAATIIQSGQAFFVQASGSTVTINLTQNDKSLSEANVFGKQAKPESQYAKLYTNLMTTGDSGLVLIDGVGAGFAKSFSSAVDNNDASKLWNFNENLALVRGTSTLSIEFRQVPKLTDTLFYRMYLRQQPYALQIFCENMPNELPARAWIVDNYLKTKTEINLYDTTVYNFTPNTDTMSYRNRFMLVFNRQLETTPVPVTKITNQANPNITGVANSMATIAAGVSIYPNPVTNTNNAVIRFNKMEKGDYEVTIYNSKGQKLDSKIITHNGGNNSYTLPLNQSWAAGIYPVTVLNKNSGNAVNLQLIIAR